MMKKKSELVIVIPVYNDAQSLEELMPRISRGANSRDKICIVIVDDASTKKLEIKPQENTSITIVSLVRNVGHQKAIAIGLSYVVDNFEAQYVLVMDSDGEDKPQDIASLIEKAKAENHSIVFARRTKRTEGFVFKMLYECYKALFRILTGTWISFGNFCVMRFEVAKRIVFISEIWLHFPGGIMKSKLPYATMPTEKGVRYAGHSKMNLQSLILHGLSSVSVYIETVAIRLLITSVLLLIMALLLMLIVVGIKIGTTLALPGWTSTMVIGLSLMFLQALLFSVLLVFIILSYRTQKSFIPAIDYKTFIQSFEEIS